MTHHKWDKSQRLEKNQPQTKLASLFAQVPARLGIGAGQTLSGTVTLQQAGDAVTIPYAALLDDGGQPYVYVVQGGIAHRRDVVPGPADGARVAIEKGVNAGDRVVVKGGTALEDGIRPSSGQFRRKRARSAWASASNSASRSSNTTCWVIRSAIFKSTHITMPSRYQMYMSVVNCLTCIYT